MWAVQTLDTPAHEFKIVFGGREGIRTPGLLVANEALSQLSYSPTSSNQILANAAHLANTPPLDCKQEGAPGLGRGAPNYSRNRDRLYGWLPAPPVRCAVILFAF